MFQWTVTQTAISGAPIQNIWNIWKNVESWPEWDQELLWSKLDGKFALNAHGSLKPKGMPIFKFKIIQLDEGKSFTTCTQLSMAKMTFFHLVKQINPSTVEIIHTVTASGLLAPFLYIVMRKSLNEGLKVSLEKLSAKAQKEL